MKKIFSAVFFIFIFACSNEEADIERFSNTYREILIVREQFADTSIANPKVRDILSKYGYTEKSFWEESQTLLKQDRKRLSIMIDSMRSAIKEDIKRNTEENAERIDSANHSK